MFCMETHGHCDVWGAILPAITLDTLISNLISSRYGVLENGVSLLVVTWDIRIDHVYAQLVCRKSNVTLLSLARVSHRLKNSLLKSQSFAGVLCTVRPYTFKRRTWLTPVRVLISHAIITNFPYQIIMALRRTWVVNYVLKRSPSPVFYFISQAIKITRVDILYRW